jgi:hypothetical protein
MPEFHDPISRKRPDDLDLWHAEITGQLLRSSSEGSSRRRRETVDRPAYLTPYFFSTALEEGEHLLRGPVVSEAQVNIDRHVILALLLDTPWPRCPPPQVP